MLKSRASVALRDRARAGSPTGEGSSIQKVESRGGAHSAVNRIGRGRLSMPP